MKLTSSLSELSILSSHASQHLLAYCQTSQAKRWIDLAWWSDVGSQYWFANSLPIVADAIAAAVESMKIMLRISVSASLAHTAIYWQTKPSIRNELLI